MSTNDPRPARILIVEDNEDMAKMYRMFFMGFERDYEMDIELDPAQALKRLEQKTYDLVVLDIIMAPMTGDSFFVYVRNNPATAYLPVIMVSVVTPASLAKLKAFGHVSFLHKPITQRQLFDEIKKMLGK